MLNKDSEVRKDKQIGKNTKCMATIKFRLKRTQTHSDDPICPLYPLQVTFKHSHNHCIVAASALKFNEVAHDTKEAFINLFSQGHSASSAYNTYTEELLRKHPTNYIEVSANRGILPSYNWVFYQHSLFKHKLHGHINSPSSYILAEDIVAKYNQKHGSNVCFMKQTKLWQAEYMRLCHKQEILCL